MGKKHIFINRNLYKDTKLVYHAVVNAAEDAGWSFCNNLAAKTADLAVSIGGDGTFIDTAKAAVNADIIGINKGTLGYMADIDEESCVDALKRYFAGDFYIQKRMTLECCPEPYYETFFDFGGSKMAVNDVAITKGDSSVIDIQVYINNVLTVTYYADGVIVSSPTGATGYSFSCGAPIVDPSSELMLITPIAPHSIMNRSICVPASAKVCIVPVQSRGNEYCVCEIDGKRYKYRTGTSLSVYKSDKTIKMVKFDESENFFGKITEKLGLR